MWSSSCILITESQAFELQLESKEGGQREIDSYIVCSGDEAHFLADNVYMRSNLFAHEVI